MTSKTKRRRRWRVRYQFSYLANGKAFMVELNYRNDWSLVAGGYRSARAARAVAQYWLGPEFETP